MKITVEVKKDGRVTFPKTMRKLFNIREGDFISFLIIEKHRPVEDGREYEEYPYVYYRKEDIDNEGRPKKED
jgi:AbrB family looped-hinge helix DNA binding protein